MPLNWLKNRLSRYLRESAAMRFKTDESLPKEAAAILRQAGHDACSALDERLGGEPDENIAAISQTEKRAIITLDKDFADIRAYPPASYSGIIVLRLSSQSKPHVLTIIRQLSYKLTVESLVGKLWIVDEKHIRIRL
ncbi:MAG: DUF5615 family PIN-like protein [Candidatus Sumerlaeota bacterium]|nr:DUF5615 family PIN-like protein [Candidatus Sumerlaeota bacterium]